MFGSLALLGVLWVLSPLVLIPLVIIFYNQNTVLKRKLKEHEEILKNQHGQTTPPSQPAIPKPVGGIQSIAGSSGVQPPTQSRPIQQTAYATKPQYTYNQPVSQPKKKIPVMNVVFLIGVIFIVVAGLIFATTTWNVLPGFAKAAIIAFLIVFFFGVSFFSRKILSLKQTGLTFYSLGCLFIPLAFLGVGYFELLGHYFSVQGDGRYLLSLFASICLTAACGFGVKIYQAKLFIWTTYFAGTGIIVSGIWQILRADDTRVLALAVYCLVVMLLTKIIKKMENIFLAMFLHYARVLLLLTGICIFLNGEQTLIYAASMAVYSVTLIAFSYEKRENVFTKIATFFVPWSTLFTYMSFVHAIDPDAKSNVFIIYYLFITLFTILVMLISGTESRLRRFVFPFSIMVWTLGVLMGCYEYFAMQEVYVQVYTWLLTLYAVTALHLKLVELRESAVEVEVADQSKDLTDEANSTVETRKNIWEIQNRLYKHHCFLSQVWMHVLAVMATLSLYVTISQLFTDWTVAECLSVPMGAAAAILMIYLIPSVYHKINIMKCESERVLFILVYALSLVTVLCWSYEYRPGYWTGIIALIAAVICQWGVRQRRNTITGILSMIVFWIVTYRLIGLTGLHDDIQQVILAVAYICTLVIGRLLYHNVLKTEKSESGSVCLFDWISISAVCVPTGLFFEDEIWRFVSVFLLILYVLNFVKRIHGNSHRPIYSIAGMLLCVAWWIQPFFQVPLELQSEYRMLPLILLSLCLYKWIWRGYEKVFTWIHYVTIVICMYWQGVDAIRSKLLSDVLILGIAALVILVMSFWIKSKRWFLLACITLAALLFYMTRTFWQSLAWWIYLLTVGVILITLASVNEYYKKKGEQYESGFKRLMQEWEW